MTNKAAAVRYARALFEVALKERADLEQIHNQLADFAGLFTQHPTLAKVLLNPAVPVQRKRAAVAEIAEQAAIVPMLRKLLLMLAERDRLVLLPDLASTFRDKWLEHQHVVRAEVTTAVPLSPEAAKQLEARLAQATGSTMMVATRIDPAIVGGLVARIGSVVYDGSVTRQLEKIRARLTESV